MKTYIKFLIATFFLLIYSCSSTNQSNKIISWDCLPFSEYELETSLLSYSYNTTANISNLSGKVYDKLTKEPLVGANSITLLPCNKETAANINGVFSFDFSLMECDSIKLSYVGYSTKVIYISELIAQFTDNNK